jgi:vitamin B12 transport system ATP-binding protein
MSQPILIANNIAYPSRLLPLSFTAKKREIIHVLGPNGSGKSTLINQLSGLGMKEGELYIDGCAVSTLSRETLSEKRALLTQAQQINFNLNVYQYLYLSLPKSSQYYLTSVKTELIKRNEIENIILDICEKLVIADKLDRNLNALSGGEWQRVRIAGICIQSSPRLQKNACLLLLDEPATGLDVAQQVNMYKLLRELAEQGLCIIMINHDINQSLSEAHKVLLLKQGEKIAFGESKEVLTEENLRKTFDTSFKLVTLEGLQFVINHGLTNLK